MGWGASPKAGLAGAQGRPHGCRNSEYQWGLCGLRGCGGGALPDSVAAMNSRNDDTTTFGTMKNEVLAFAQARDWEQFHSPKNLSMAIAAEAAELMEPLLWVSPEESRAVMKRPDKRAALQDELADIVVYCLEFANQTGIDLTTAITAKMARNAEKYPVEKARGRAEKYNEL